MPSLMYQLARKILLFFLITASFVFGLSLPAKASESALGAAAKAYASGNKQNSLVVGGTPADPNDWPFFASVSAKPLYPYNNSNHPYCGASLVGGRWLLTAAHCFIFWGGEAFYATIGRADLLTNTGESIRGKNVFLHPRFGSKQENYAPAYDAALLKLTDTSSATQIPLAERSPGPGSEVSLAGFGVSNTITGNLPTTLLETQNNTITNDECRSLSPRGAFFFFESQICTETSNFTGACYGDSGGPLVRGGNLVGLVSTGDAYCQKGGKADIYTKVSGIRDWVLATIKRGTSRGRISWSKGDSMGSRKFLFLAQTNSAAKRARVQFNRRVCVKSKCYKKGRSFALNRIPIMEYPGRYKFIRWSKNVFRLKKGRCLGSATKVRFHNGDFDVRKRKVCTLK